MLKTVFSDLLLVGVGLLLLSSEVWLAPRKFHYQLGEEMKVDFLEGDNYSGEFWDLGKNKVDLLEWHSGAGVRDLTKTIKTTPGNNLSFKFTQTGTQLLVMTSQAYAASFSKKTFNAFLEDQGLEGDPAFRKSAATGDSIKMDNIRFAKVIVQVGEKIDNNFKKQTGLPLEIVIDKNPYLTKTGDYVECLVLFDGKPLPHTLVRVWNRLNRTTFQQDIYSENDGTIKFPISTKGSWMISTIKMIPSEKKGMNWRVMWHSLAFGIE